VSLTLEVSGPGTCTVTTCVTPMALTAKKSEACTYNCTDNVTGVRVLAEIDAGSGNEQLDSGAAATQVLPTPKNGPSECVLLTSAYFKDNSPFPPGWVRAGTLRVQMRAPA
jgi:hypothetical protein